MSNDVSQHVTRTSEYRKTPKEPSPPRTLYIFNEKLGSILRDVEGHDGNGRRRNPDRVAARNGHLRDATDSVSHTKIQPRAIRAYQPLALTVVSELDVICNLRLR
jgi:hypothetical protein